MTHHCLLGYDDLENILRWRIWEKFLLNKSEPDFEFWDEKYSKQLEFQGVYTWSQKNNTQTQPRSLPPVTPVKRILLWIHFFLTSHRWNRSWCHLWSISYVTSGGSLFCIFFSAFFLNIRLIHHEQRLLSLHRPLNFKMSNLFIYMKKSLQKKTEKLRRGLTSHLPPNIHFFPSGFTICARHKYSVKASLERESL